MGGVSGGLEEVEGTTGNQLVRIGIVERSKKFRLANAPGKKRQPTAKHIRMANSDED